MKSILLFPQKFFVIFFFYRFLDSFFFPFLNSALLVKLNVSNEKAVSN